MTRGQKSTRNRSAQIMKWTDVKYPNGKWY